MTANARLRTVAATAAVVAAVSLLVTAPVTATAKVHGGPTTAVALVAPGQPPAPCLPGRWKCPLGPGAL